MDRPDVTEELRELLELTRAEIDAILARLPEVNSVDLVALLESLALRDQQRVTLLDALRQQASQTRRREEDRSIRQFVLQALREVGGPQTAGFLEDYIYARERVVLKTRGFAALRRDENRAWRRRPGYRVAYITPCLDENGLPVSRWMGRSDWNLEDRILVPGVEALWGWMRVRALVHSWRHEDSELGDPLYIPLLERYVGEARGEVVELEATGSEHVLAEQFEAEAATEIERLAAVVRPARLEAARRLTDDLDPEERLWGSSDAVRRTRGHDLEDDRLGRAEAQRAE